MATQLENVNRRVFLSGTAGAISGAALLPNGEVQAELSELEQMARALHKTVGRYSDQNAPSIPVQAYSPRTRTPFMFALENLRACSVDEIQHLLKPLFAGSAA